MRIVQDVCRLKRVRRLAVALAYLMLLAHASSAVDLRNVLVDYSVTSWTAKDGLPAGTVSSIVQDREGYLWLGGSFGLFRFDGVRFDDRSWSLAEHAPAAHLRIELLCAAQDGSLWVAFSDRVGLVRIHAGRVTGFYDDASSPRGMVTALFEDQRGIVWVVSDGTLYQFATGHWTKLPGDPTIAEHRILTASVAPSGSLLVVTPTGVFQRATGEDRFHALERSDLSANSVHAVAEDTFSRKWITDRLSGFRQVAPSTAVVAPTESGKGFRLLADRRGNLWLATYGQGLWRVRFDGAEKATMERVTDLTGLSNNVVSSLFEDRDGNIWAGTTNGLNRLSPHKLTHIASLGLVTGLEVTKDGTVWAGTGTRVQQLVAATGMWRQWSLGEHRLDAMAADRHGALWVAAGNRLLRFDSSAAGPRLVTDQLRQIKALTTDGHDGVWLFDLNRGLLHWTGKTIVPGALSADLAHARFTAMLTDRNGQLWMATSDGRVASCDGAGSCRLFGMRNGAAGASRIMYEDDHGVIWLAGSRGLARFTGNDFTLLSLPGFLNESVTGVVDDTNGWLWFGTASGIARVKRDDVLNPARERDAQSTLYDSADGVAGTTGWIGQRSAIRAADGRLWFLTAEGITVIDPISLEQTGKVAPVHIDGIVVGDAKQAATPSMTLGPGATRLEIDYSILNLTAPRRTRFRYRLDGFDTDWVDAGLARQAVYTNLAPRAYKFRVEANDDRGAWSASSTDWNFSVRPAFYQTNWFILLCATTVGVGAWGAWRLRLRHVRRNFSVLLGERVRLSRELHDTLLQSLVGVTLQLDILGHDIVDPRHLESALGGTAAARSPHGAPAVWRACERSRHCVPADDCRVAASVPAADRRTDPPHRPGSGRQCHSPRTRPAYRC